MDDEKLLKCLWLNCFCGHSPHFIDKCVKRLGSAEAIFDGAADKDALKETLGLKHLEYRRRNLKEAEELLESCRRKNIRTIHISDPEYPRLLKNTYAPPQILYVKGLDVNLNDLLTISVVGTRKASNDAKKFTRKLCREMAEEGIVVVSGMAKGLDAEAHKGALDAGQLTVAVLAGGVDLVYPRENAELYEKIGERGMIISERPPGMKGRGYFYQERNRIIAGLSYGVVITEGGVKSGTSITVKYAQEYNRDIFAVPGRPADDNAALPNGLIHDGAITTLSAADVLDEYGERFGELLERGIMELKPVEKPAFRAEKKVSDEKPVEKTDFSDSPPNERKILEFLYNFGAPAHIDEIIRNTELKPSEVNSAVVLLQLKGRLRQRAGNMYSLEI